MKQSIRHVVLASLLVFSSQSALAQLVANAGPDTTIKVGETVQLDANGVLQRQKLSKVMQGLINFESAYKSFPSYAGALASENVESSCQTSTSPPFVSSKPLFSWRVCILPFIGESELYNQFDRSKAWDDPVNLSLLDKMPDVFRGAGESLSSTHTSIVGVFSPLNNGSVFTLFNSGHDDGSSYSPETTEIREFNDGSSNTIAIGQTTRSDIPWTKPEDLDVLKYPSFCDFQGFDSHSTDYVNVAMLDGTARGFSCAEDSSNQANLLNGQDRNLIIGLVETPEFGVAYDWDLDGDSIFETSGPSPVLVATQAQLGMLKVGLRVTDAQGNQAFDTVVVDIESNDTQPPVIKLTKPIWTIHRRATYGLFSVADLVESVNDNLDTTLSRKDIKIVSVQSDEKPRRDHRNSHVAQSYAKCRAAALKTDHNRGGNGRVYTLLLQATDASGNVGSASVEVQVPPHLPIKKRAVAIKDETVWSKEFSCD